MSRKPKPPEYLLVGKVVGTWGSKGEIKVVVLTSFPHRFAPGITLFVGDERQPHAIEYVKWHRNVMVLKLTGIDSIGQAEALVSSELWIPFEQRMPLEEGEYYLYEILGLRVVTEDGRDLGTLEEVLETPSNDVYVVKGQGREYLIPAIRDAVLRIDPQEGVMVVRLLPGLE